MKMTPAEDREFRRVVDGVQEDNRDLSSVSSLSSTPRSWPAPLADEAFHGLAGEIGEADPAVLLTVTLIAFGNAIGRCPGWEIGGTFHATNTFALVVGHTSAGRKGTGFDAPRPIFALADADWSQERAPQPMWGRAL